MKKLHGYLIGTILFLISFSSYSQCTCLPDSIITNIVDELIVKDGMAFELNRKDSIIIVYKHELGVKGEQIAELKLNAKEYETIISNKDRLSEYLIAESKDLKRTIRKLKIQKALLTALAVVEVVFIGLIAL